MNPNWRNAKKKESDDLPAIQAVSELKKEYPAVSLKKLITAGQFPFATFFRYVNRAELGVPLWGPRGKPHAVTVEDDIVKAIAEAWAQWGGQRRRLPGVNAIKAKVPDMTEAALQQCRNEIRSELVYGMDQSMISVQYCEPHLIWSMDIFERIHRGVKFHVLQVIDLGSRIKLAPAIKTDAFTGDEVAQHINMLFHLHGAPLFLKRDNGSNLNSSGIFKIMNMFSAIPFNSPPGCPQFNGVMERSQGEVKRYLSVMLKEVEAIDVFASFVYSAVDRANNRKRPVLKGQTAQQIWLEEYLHFNKREREAIYEEIKHIAAQILNNFSPSKKQRKDAAAGAWRRAIQRWLEDKNYIKLFRDGKPLRQKTA